MTLLAFLLVASLQAPATTPAAALSDPPTVCDSCDEWNQPQAPFKLHGNSYYVGVRGLSAVVIQTSAGLVLMDGGLPQSAPLIEASIESLGLRVKDIKLIVNSHAHYDHAGGIARLQRASGATVVASARGAEALMSGMPTPDDPQYGPDGKDGAFPRVPKVRIVKDREELRLGDTTVTAHLTPGHTPGSTAWSWKSCEGARCIDIVYADSLTAVASEGFRFLGDASHRDVSETFKRSIDTVKSLPCDLMLSTHPGASGLFERLKRRTGGTSSPDPLIDSDGCRTYAANASRNLEARLKAERAASTK